MKHTPRFLACLAVLALSLIPAQGAETKLAPQYNTNTPPSSFSQEPDLLCEGGCRSYAEELPVPVHASCLGECGTNPPDFLYLTKHYAQVAGDDFNIPLDENPLVNTTVILLAPLDDNGPDFNRFNKLFQDVDLFPTDEERNAKEPPKVHRIIDMPE